jgi:hypothetical protein
MSMITVGDIYRLSTESLRIIMHFLYPEIMRFTVYCFKLIRMRVWINASWGKYIFDQCMGSVPTQNPEKFG